MLGFVLYLICRLLIRMLMTVLLIRTPGVVVLFRYIHSSTLFLQHPIPASFLSKANLRLAFASALLMCDFQVCLLSKVIPRYVALSVCCSSVSSNIIFKRFSFIDLYTPGLIICWLLLGVVLWQLLHILLCSIGLSHLHTLYTSLVMEIS